MLCEAAQSKKPQDSPAPPTTSPSQRLGSAESWTAYAYKEKAGKVCYLTGEPLKREPAAKLRRSMAMVTHRPGENIANVVSFVIGYPLKEGSDVSLDVGGAKFDLFTKGDSAKGKQAVARGTPRKSPPTTDTYSLTGFPQALAMIDKACDIKR